MGIIAKLFFFSAPKKLKIPMLPGTSMIGGPVEN